MNSARMTFCLLIVFLLIFISPLFSDTENDSVFNDNVLYEDVVSADNEEEFVPDNDLVLIIDDETLTENEHDEPFFPDEDTFITEEYDDSYVFEAPPLIIEVPVYEMRSFDDIFPDFTRNQKAWAMSSSGLRNSFEGDGSPILLPCANSGIDLISSVMAKRPSHVVEALLVVPYKERELDMLDIYNALGRIENLKDHKIPSGSNDVVIFSNTTRLESARNRRPIPDPLPANLLPFSETMYLRLTDAIMGDIFVRGDISISMYGITYSMTNFTDIRFALIPVMRAERFSAILYLEPVKEGILVYSMSGLYLPDVIARRMNLPLNINRRVTVLISWITEGLRAQEIVIVEQNNDSLEG